MSDEREDINEDEVAEEPQGPVFDQYELAKLNGLVPVEGQEEGFNLSYKLFESNPEGWQEGAYNQLDQCDELLSQAGTDEDIARLEQHRALIVEAMDAFPRLHQERQMEAEFRAQLYQKEFEEAKKSGDWSRVFKLKNIIPGDDLAEDYRQESLKEAKAKIIQEAISTGDFSLAGRLDKLMKPPVQEPSLAEIEQEEDAREKRSEHIKKLCEKARRTGDWTAVLRFGGLPH